MKSVCQRKDQFSYSKTRLESKSKINKTNPPCVRLVVQCMLNTAMIYTENKNDTRWKWTVWLWSSVLEFWSKYPVFDFMKGQLNFIFWFWIFAMFFCTFNDRDNCLLGGLNQFNHAMRNVKFEIRKYQKYIIHYSWNVL